MQIITLFQFVSAALLALAANAEVYFKEQFLDGGKWTINVSWLIC